MPTILKSLMITWQFFLPFTNSKIRGYSWKIKLLPNPVGNKPNTSFFFSSAAIHFFCSSFKQSIFGKLSRALSIASSKLNAAIFVYSSWSSTSHHVVLIDQSAWPSAWWTVQHWWNSKNNGLRTGALFFSSPRLALRARIALRAKYRVRPAWLIKRLSCRLV